MTERDIDLIQQSKVYERILHADPHNRRPARGNDIGNLKQRRKRRNSNRWVRRLAQEWRWR